MKQSFYLAYKYLWFHRVRTLVLVASIGLILYLPNGLQKLISESERQMMARADATPLIIGSKGSSTDLVINTLYFEREELDPVNLRVLEELNETGFGYSIPMLSAFHARGFSIVGTNLDYFSFRGLEVEQGRMLSYVGECLLGSRVAEELDLQPGDSLISSPENFFDLAGIYPLRMEVVGVLAPSNTPDDLAVFSDLKTNWIIMGLGHGHQDVSKVNDPTLVLDKDSANVTASAKLYIYNEVDGKDLESFHFHGDVNTYPITAVLYVPKDEKSSTLLRGRFKSGEIGNQVVVPSQVVDKLLQSIFRIKQIFNTVFILVGVATLLILGLIMILSLRLRKEELFTMFTIGSSRYKTIEILGLELVITLVLSLTVAWVLYSFTGYFVEDFIRNFII